MSLDKKLKPIVCIGDLVADIFTSPVDKLPQPGESVITKSTAIYPGGNSLNTAVALRKMGDNVTVAGSIGNDSLGNLVLQQLKDLNLNIDGVLQEQGSTDSTIIMRQKDEDRRFLSSLGVGQKFTGKNISFDLIPQNGVVLIAGYLKLANWDDEYLIDFLKEAKRGNNKVVLNVCNVINNLVNPKRVIPLLKYVDIFLPNENEAFAITDHTDIKKQANSLMETGVKQVIITRGSEGLYYQNKNNQVKMGVIKVDVVDPSGCGDCFTAGILASLSRDWDYITMLKFGSAVAAIGATKLGCNTAIPNFNAVEQFLPQTNIEVEVIEL